MMAPIRQTAGLFLLLCLLGFAAAAYSQGYIKTVEDSAFSETERMRPVVAFNHDQHNEAAGISECNTCHHVYKNGEKLPDQASYGMECSSCHLVESKDRLDLIRVYHLQCKACHLAQKAGPVQCGGCPSIDAE